LRLHRERQQVLKLLQEAGGRKNDLIFPSKVGTPRDPSNLRLRLQRGPDKAGLPKIRFHDLRHTAASLMLNHGVPYRGFQKGWAFEAKHHT